MSTSHRILRAALLLGCWATVSAPTARAIADPNMIMVMGSAGGNPNDLILVSLAVQTHEEVKGDVTRVAGLDLTLLWDASLASLEGVSLTDATQNWQIATNPEAGKVSLSLATIDPVSATPAGLEVVQFRFQLLNTTGQSALELRDTRAFDITQTSIEHITIDGQLDVGMVEAKTISVGWLKAAFPGR